MGVVRCQFYIGVCVTALGLFGQLFQGEYLTEYMYLSETPPLCMPHMREEPSVSQL